ncbi:MAG TPA: hypothetical protein VF984_11935 [Actinomycetota bacterium]
MVEGTLAEQITALEEGRAFVVWADLRLLRVGGGDARAWLQDLITTDVQTLGASSVRRSLLLTPAGRIRADFHVYGMDDGTFVLSQGDDQPEALGDLLAPYVLSSDVRLQPVEHRLVSVPGSGAVPADLQTTWSPSALGEGFDVLVAHADGLVALRASLAADRLEAGPEASERWRILHGRARFPVDLDPDSLPAEAGLEGLVDFTKGCFLGQESVAKVRNLGHPPRVVLSLGADGPVTAGEPVRSEDRDVGVVTSAAPNGSGSAVLARIRWGARGAPLATASGVSLRPR